DITNTGGYDGAEAAQVYVKDVECSIFREEKALKGFEKIFLKKGEKKTVSVTLDTRAFAFYNVNEKDWTAESGLFEIHIGASSRDIRLCGNVEFKSRDISIPNYKEKAPVYYNIGAAGNIPDKQFEELLGRELTENRAYKKGEIDYNATLEDVRCTAFGRLVRWAAYTFAAVVLPKGSPLFLKKMVKMSSVVMPLRSMFTMTNGQVAKETVDGIIMAFNGKFFKGIFKALKSLRKKKAMKKSEIYKK
ncbi:MAG: fibronectin type III-like domain-contianing protein, partial [Clostridia bacterium]|nr:fibronectin type III-like domain-contianing protein [Clostridia bacterium]